MTESVGNKHSNYSMSLPNYQDQLLNKAKQILDQKSRSSLVLPYFIYCAEIWGHNYKN